MGARLALVFFVGVLLIASPSIAQKPFDFFFLVLMWPGAYCAQSKCCVPKGGIPADDFFVSGLWTYNATTGKEVSRCNYNNTNFYINQLTDISNELYSRWSNIQCPSRDPKDLWKSNWKSYGTCSNLTEAGYFKAALDLAAKVDVLSLLAKKGIVPEYNLYKVSDIKSAIAEGIGAAPLIRCSTFGPAKSFQLYQVHICVDSDASTIIECPVVPKYTCSDEIVFHPFRYWMLNGTTTTTASSLAAAAAAAAEAELPIAME